MIQKLFKKIREESSFKKYFLNTSWLMGEKIFRIGISALVGVLVVRHLQPEGFGKLSYAISFVTLFSTLSTLGLDNIIIKHLVNDNGARDSYLGTSFILKLFGSVIGTLASIALIFLTNFDNSTRVLVTIISFTLILQSFNVIDYFFQAHVMAKYSVYSLLASVIVSSIFKVMLIILNAPLIYFGFAYTLEAVVLAIGLVLMVQLKQHSITQWRFDARVAKSFIKLSLPLIISGAMVTLYMRIDQVMIKNMLGDVQTGLYSSAVNLSEAWYFIPVALVGSFYPALISAKANIKLFEKRTKQLFALLLAVSLPMALVIALFSNLIITILYGETYEPAAEVLKVHIWSGIFVFLGVASSRWLIIEDLQNYSTVVTAIGAVINIGLNFILLPRIGMVGAAWATLIAYAISGSFGYLLFAKTRRCFSLQLQSIPSLTRWDQ